MTRGRKDRWVALVVLGVTFLFGIACGRCFAMNKHYVDASTHTCTELNCNKFLVSHEEFLELQKKDFDKETCQAKHPENYGGHE